MTDFYERVLGLARLQPGERGGHSEGIRFFRLAESYGGHVSVLALFADDLPGVSMSPEAHGGKVEAGRRSSLHHLALTVAWDEQDAVVRWLEKEGLEARVVPFGWVGWRGIFTRDPDGNTVELVAADPEWHLR